MNRYGFEPDFENFRAVLMGGRGSRVPNVELVIDQEVKEAFLSRPVRTLADDTEFRYQAGYDYVWISVGMIDPAGTVNKDLVRDGSDKHFAGKDARVWADEHKGAIGGWEDFEAYPWPDPARLDWSPFVEARKHLKPGMKVLAIVGKIFTAAWQLTGFERFCELTYDDAALVDAMMKRIGAIEVEACRRALEFDTVGGIFAPDDIAYHSGTMLPPKWFVEKLFPWYREMTAMCRAAGKPFIYHSDGDMNAMVDTIIDSGINALHPIEPESMDIYALRERVGRRLCLLGNIRVHTLATGTPAEVRELVKDRVLRLGHEGAYCVGSSNSVPNYVKMENYLAMLEASAEYGGTE